MARTKRNAAGAAKRILPLTDPQLRLLQRGLLAWFRANQRGMPWRRTRDPYRIWLSEVMLQQTRVAAVLPYYERFLARFPSVRALARARTESVLKAWAGLGYYSRARNLRRAAQHIVKHHRGRFPRTLEDSLALPGVGRYIAAAVLSIAYGAPLAVLDGNVARVLARLGAVRGDLREAARWQSLEATAQSLLARRAPGDWNQAVMELGATVCTPRAPACGRCPLAPYCRARARGLTEQIPEKRRKRAPLAMRLAVAVLLDPQGRTLLLRNGQQPHAELFSRMWQFPAVGVASAAEAEAALTCHLRESLGLASGQPHALPAARHTVTYRAITLLPYLLPLAALPDTLANGASAAMEIACVPLVEVQRLPASSATRKIARAAQHNAQLSLAFPASPAIG